MAHVTIVMILLESVGQEFEQDTVGTICSLLFPCLTGRLEGGGDLTPAGAARLKACSLMCLADDASCWLRP
jgi:hypothetical protein